MLRHKRLPSDGGFAIADMEPLARRRAPMAAAHFEALAEAEPPRGALGSLAFALRAMGDAAAPAVDALASREVSAIETLPIVSSAFPKRDRWGRGSGGATIPNRTTQPVGVGVVVGLPVGRCLQRVEEAKG